MEARKAITGYRIIEGSTHELADVQRFMTSLDSLADNPDPTLRGLFDTSGDLLIARAPGRLDVMGGIADYSGSLVLQLPIAEATLVALQLDGFREITIVSLSGDATRDNSFTMSLSDFEVNGKTVDYEFAQDRFKKNERQRWAAYVAGVFLVLMRERGVHFERGARLLIDSGVPEGKGVSSSAAIEVAVMSAVSAAFDLELDSREIALMCQIVENQVVGAPCGIMDQMTSACGDENRLLALLCQPAELKDAIELPEELGVWGLDSDLRHSVGSGDYGSVRTGAFMGYRIIAELAGLPVLDENPEDRIVKISDNVWHNYLSNVTPSEFEERFAARIPDRITGEDFLRNYRGTTDLVTRVEADRAYAVKQPTAHAIYENFRVRTFAALLQNPTNERTR